MRAGILAFLHESNTFAREPTTLEDFEHNILLGGPDLAREFEDAPHEVGGFLEGLARAGIESVPLLAARALPSGTIAAATLDRLLALTLAALRRAGPLDGILAAAHGAAASTDHPEADARWFALVRRHLGPDVPIVATLDLHANLSPRAIASTDALVAYRTNPHTDQRRRGLEAASLLARALAGRVRLVQRAAHPPLACGIEAQSTSEPPCAEIFALLERTLDEEPVLSASILLGFPYADVETLGVSTVAVTDGAPGEAQCHADSLAEALWTRREELLGKLVSPAEALETACRWADRGETPVCLLDMGDNVGAGAPGDGTALARAFHERRLAGACAVLCDPEAAERAARAGRGRRLHLSAGGKSDPRHGEPLEADFTVVSLHGGRFEERAARHGGMTRFDQGLTAVVRTEGGLTLVLTSRRMVPFSLEQLRSCGVDAGAFKWIAVKGVHAPVAAYREVCRRFLRVDTPGATPADMRRLEYHRRRRPLYPFEPEARWEPARPE